MATDAYAVLEPDQLGIARSILVSHHVLDRWSEGPVSLELQDDRIVMTHTPTGEYHLTMYRKRPTVHCTGFLAQVAEHYPLDNRYRRATLEGMSLTIYLQQALDRRDVAHLFRRSKQYALLSPTKEPERQAIRVSLPPEVLERAQAAADAQKVTLPRLLSHVIEYADFDALPSILPETPMERSALAINARQAGHQLTGPELIEKGLIPASDPVWLREQLEAGHTLTELAARYGGKYQTYGRWRDIHGIQTTKRPPKPSKDTQRQLVLELYPKGVPAKQIAERLGLAPSVIQKLVKRMQRAGEL